MSTELEIARMAEKQQKVVSLYAACKTLPQIIRETGFSKREVEFMLAEYKEYAQQDKVLRELARETVLKTKLHYDELISKMYEAVSTAESIGDYKAQMSGLKAIADMENQRVTFMQKAGILADNEIGEQLLEYERKHKLIVDILRDVVKRYPNVGLEIQGRLKEITGVLEGVPAERVDI